MGDLHLLYGSHLLTRWVLDVHILETARPAASLTSEGAGNVHHWAALHVSQGDVQGANGPTELPRHTIRTWNRVGVGVEV